MDDHVDCAVVGAGPAGLTAALYLARFRRPVLALHDGESRALRIPLTHNAPGFPGGVKGSVLVRRMTVQARTYGARVERGRVERIERAGPDFVLHAGRRRTTARTVILATGVRLNEIDLPRPAHEAAIKAGCLRYCPICDGFEATGRRVAVVGSDTHGAAEALFLRQFTDRVTLIPRDHAALARDERRALAEAGVDVTDAPLAALEPGEGRMTVRFDARPPLEVDVLYPALGSEARRELARQLGVELSDEGCVVTDQRQATSVPGVFAAGDVVEGLDQISVAMGHGALAATAAHNHLRQRDAETLPE